MAERSLILEPLWWKNSERFSTGCIIYISFIKKKFMGYTTKGIWSSSIFLDLMLSTVKEDIGIEQQLNEIVSGKNFALNCLSWKFTKMIMVTNEVFPENLIVVS